MTKGDFMVWFSRLSLMRLDVEMQGFCQIYAAAYNAKRPQKRVNFLNAFLICLHKSPAGWSLPHPPPDVSWKGKLRASAWRWQCSRISGGF